MNILPVKFHTLFLPELLEGPLMLDDLPAVYPEYHADDWWQSMAMRHPA